MSVFDVLPEAHFHLRSPWQATSKTSTQWQNSRKQTRQTRQNTHTHTHTHTNTLSGPVLEYNKVHTHEYNFKVLCSSTSILCHFIFSTSLHSGDKYNAFYSRVCFTIKTITLITPYYLLICFERALWQQKWHTVHLRSRYAGFVDSRR